MNNTVSILNGTVIVVADHSKALLLKNIGSAPSPTLEVMQVLEAPDNPPTHEQGTDRPGRTFYGNQRSAVEQTDFHEQSGKKFLQMVTEALESANQSDNFRSVVLVAPPKALADLRNLISAEVRAVVVGEIDKDLVKMPITEIARHLAA